MVADMFQINELANQVNEKDRTGPGVDGRPGDGPSASTVLAQPVQQAPAQPRPVRRIVKGALSEILRKILGQKPWPHGEPQVSQGFAGESIGEPPPSGYFPLVSVIMPVYNACRSNKRFLLLALESIARQTYRNVELVIVDDGSTDDTRQVCQEFLRSHPGLQAQLLCKENSGQSGARNFGVKACKGEYIGFLDQDDEWYEDKLERVVPWLAHSSIDVLYTDSDVIDCDGAVSLAGIHQNAKYGWPHPKKTLEDILFKDVFVMPGLMTIKKSAFEHIAGFDENLSGYEDDDLFLRLFERFRVFYLPTPTLRWRMYGDNYSFSSRMLTSRMYFWKKLIANYTSHGTDDFRKHMISLRFFWQFMGQSKAQLQLENDLCWDSWQGAKEIWSSLPIVQRVLFYFIFLFPSRAILPLLARGRDFIRGK